MAVCDWRGALYILWILNAVCYTDTECYTDGGWMKYKTPIKQYTMQYTINTLTTQQNTNIA